ncbi:MAG: cobalamin-binding protein [Methanolobus sp.]|jgi:iron complex transport system substrate-binding protein|nr:cobalamin-binding protein [Methanolobus sp.]
MLKRILFILIITFLLLIPNTLASDNNTVEYPVSITDSSSASIIIEKEPERIVSLMPSITEILFTIGAGDKVVGGTEDDKYPPEAANLTKVGRYTTLNYETVAQLEPDLVILDDEANGEETVEQFKELKIQTISTSPKTIDEIEESILLLGTVTNNIETAESVVNDMERIVAEVQESTSGISDEDKPRVLYIVWDEPITAAGKKSYLDDLISMAGGKNIVEASDWPTITIETVVDANPEIIICSGMGGLSYQIMNNIKKNEAFATLDAIKNDRVYPINDPNIIELSGPRIVQGLKELNIYMGPDWNEKTYSSLIEDDLVETDNKNTAEEKIDQEDKDVNAQANGFQAFFACCILILGSIIHKRY